MMTIPATNIDVNWGLITGIGGFFAGVLAMIFRKGKAVQAIESKLEQHSSDIAEIKARFTSVDNSIDALRKDIVEVRHELNNGLLDIAKTIQVLTIEVSKIKSR
jgi:septal ring factor EnvC (AmiA/AmiB activator)